jgi:hypothetical protein
VDVILSGEIRKFADLDDVRGDIATLDRRLMSQAGDLRTVRAVGVTNTWT